MDIKIYYCGVWNYLPKASRLEEELKTNFSNVQIDLIKGSGGIFEVLVNEKLIFDKLNTEFRFPKENEITNKINSL